MRERGEEGMEDDDGGAFLVNTPLFGCMLECCMMG